MKNKSIITILSLCLGLSLATTSCEDMLSSNSDRHSYEVAGDTLYSYWGILKSLQNLGERYVILGECRGELVDGGEFTTDSVNAMLSFGLNGDTENIKDGANRYLKVSDYYHVINSCNAYLAQADSTIKKTDGVVYMHAEMAQVEAIRAWVYMQLVVNYGDVPFYLDPKLATNDIIAFDTKNPENRVNASNLWQKLESKLQWAYRQEEHLGYPNYEEYGQNPKVVHSSKTMFPTALVLADLYLMGNQYHKAAEYYYNFLEDEEYGGDLPLNYYSTAFLPQGKHTVESSHTKYPWTETGKLNKDEESITAIPSSTNSLWGIVQRGVNDLFGFESTIRQSTGSDSTITSSISLSRNWERQLGPSAGYDSLRLDQVYEIYQVSEFDKINDEECRLVQLDSVGDARGVAGEYGSGFISRYNSGDYYIDEVKTERYIMKQNPFGSYSTVYPMVYRRSMVWLRYAEALNRAGYPGYAFAVLKNGLTKNNLWLPREASDFVAKKQRIHYEHLATFKNSNGEDVEELVVLPSDWETNEACVITGQLYDDATYQENIKNFMEVAIAEAEAKYPGYISTVTDPIENIISEDLEYANFQPDVTSIVCDYISRNEWEKAQGLNWLDFDKPEFGKTLDLPIHYIQNFPLESNTRPIGGKYPTSAQGSNYITRGIHQKGCGLLKYDEKNSWYNYVGQINRKLKEMKIITNDLSKKEIYEGDQELVILAVEELILDEAGLELAFEGSRFFDIMRVANRRANPGKYMADKIRTRGKNTESWVDNLENNPKSWYLPLPDMSNR